MKNFFIILITIFSFQLSNAQTVLDIIVNSPEHETLESAVIAAGLNGTLSGPGPLTVFAPTDAAFSMLDPQMVADLFSDPAGILSDYLKYHVFEGNLSSTDLFDGQVLTMFDGNTTQITVNTMTLINDATITGPDVSATNGVVHIIDVVLIPPVNANTVVDIIVDSPVHTTLETAVVAAELDDDLAGAGPFTVFAPTDAAFDALPPGTLDDLLMNPTGDLADILLYHVLGSTVLAGDVTNGLITDPLNNANSLKFTVTSGSDVFVNQAEVTITNLIADNGVVHVIDAVILPSETVVDVAIDNGFTTLTTAVVEAELLPALTEPFQELTVFAPSDAAFDALPTGVLSDLLLDPTGDLQDILLYHVLGIEVASADINNGQIVDPLNTDNSLKLTKTNTGDVFVNQAQVSLPDVEADNGIVHVIDAVVLPSETVLDVAIDNGFAVLAAAVTAAELIPALSDPFAEYTVFAPSDAAFNALPTALLADLLSDPTGDLRDILLYHVLDSEVPSGAITNGLITDPLNNENTIKLTLTSANSVFVNQAQVSLPDVAADNGIVHVIDAVILPSETVVDIAIDNDFTTLTSAVVAAELVPALSDPFGTLTVFAPTNDAFADLPDGTLDDLLADPTGDLADILLYHVVGSVALSSDLSDGQVIETLLGEDVSVSIDASVMINSSTVTLPDLESDNGVVHVINMVLLPPTSILELSDLNISIFPNPSADFIQINSDSQIQSLEIFDLNGAIVFSENQVQNNRVDLSDLASGLYEIRVSVDGSVGTSKLLKK